MKKMRKSNFFLNFTGLFVWPPYEQTRKIRFFFHFFSFFPYGRHMNKAAKTGISGLKPVWRRP